MPRSDLSGIGDSCKGSGGAVCTMQLLDHLGNPEYHHLVSAEVQVCA